VGVVILVMYVDTNGIQHHCEELGSEFEKFVVMTMNPGADLDSLSILDNPDNLVVYACAAFILEFSYLVINNLSQVNYFRSYSTLSFSKKRLFISCMTIVLLHYLLGITDCNAGRRTDFRDKKSRDFSGEIFLERNYCPRTGFSGSNP